MAVTEQSREPSLGELFGSLTGDMKQLVQQEVRLAKVELGHKLSLAARNVALMLAGTGILYAGFITLLWALVGVLGNALSLPWWQAGLIVGALAAGIGVAVAGLGLSALRAQRFTPQQTVTTLKEDARWLKSK